MQLFIVFSLFLYSCVSKAQQNKYTAIHFTIRDCRNPDAQSWFTKDSIRFYKMPEDSLAYTVPVRGQKNWPVIIENAAIGDYKMVYRNIYHETVEEPITLYKQPHNEVTACVDKLLNYPQNTLATMTQNDSLVLKFTSTGCFHGEDKKLVITKEQENFVGRLFDVTGYWEKKKKQYIRKYKDGPLLATTILTPQNLQDFIRFENELNEAKKSGCTTTDWYELSTKNITIEKADGSCKWWGFNFLRQSFFKDL